MSDVGGFSAADVDIVLKVVTNHSDKHIASDDEWVEFGKDVDVLDCFLYPHALDEYLLTKPLDKVRHYLSRAKAVWTELGIPCQPGFSSLDHYSSEGWLTKGSRLPEGGFAGLCTIMEDDPYQAPVAVVRMDDSLIAFHSTGMAPKVTTSGRSKVEPPSHNEALLFWPGICRYERLTFDEAALKGIPVISLEGVNT